MNNENKLYDRQGTPAKNPKTMQTLSATKRFRRQPQQAARCKGCAVEQATFSTAGFIANGFLNHRFLPLYGEAEQLPENKDMEKGVFNSLSILEKYYFLQPLDVSDKPYPYNILLAYWDAERQICKGRNDTELLIVSDKSETVKFATKESAFGGSTLYYIPVLPLYRLMKNRTDKYSADLLLSVFAYLYQVAHIPFYRDEDSFLNCHYAMLEDWLENDMGDLDEQDISFNRSALRSASHYGDIMHRRIYNKYNLENFKDRIDRLKPTNDLGRECLKVAQLALLLWKTYPDGYLFKHIDNGCEEEQGEDEDEDDYYDRRDNTLYVHEYVHFIAETEGSLYDSLFEMLNSEFNEKQFTQEPVLITLYDQSLNEKNDTLDFEHGLFALINELCNILNDLP